MIDVYTQLSGEVVALHVGLNDHVEENDPIATIAAMKLELVVVAPARGRVLDCLVNIGEVVDTDTVIARIEIHQRAT